MAKQVVAMPSLTDRPLAKSKCTGTIIAAKMRDRLHIKRIDTANISRKTQLDFKLKSQRSVADLCKNLLQKRKESGSHTERGSSQMGSRIIDI